VEEARRVLTRLTRIEALDPASAPTWLLIEELRALVVEAEAWARVDGDSRARSAAAALMGALAAVDESADASTGPSRGG